ncbi:zinc finger protein 454 [Aedes albopictus]|uniref:C2h2-type zn-finger protein n=1 Tax=Aedes albopictus TaxID=7160 RepID=A0ABM1XPJ5_AEDAL|nr:zinc finger protein 454-like [Aedes albopictus]
MISNKFVLKPLLKSKDMEKVKIESKSHVIPRQVCRLCLGEKLLNNIFLENVLHQWISAYLSIEVSTEDHMSQLICAGCRIRLTEFHQFRLRCQEVQCVQLSMIHMSTGVNDPAKDIGTIAQVQLVGEEEQSALSIVCEVCHKVFKTNKQLFNHRRIHKPKKHRCTSCRKSFVRREHLDKHIKMHNAKLEEGNELQNKEPSTRASNSTELGLLTNQLDHQFPDQQPISVKLEPLDEDISYGESKFSDSVEPMIDIGQPKVEERSDSEVETPSDGLMANDKPNPEEKCVEKPFKCDLCQKRFLKKRRLDFHTRYIHGAKSHICPICERPFRFRHHMLDHTRTHLSPHERQQMGDQNARPFECDVCHKTFKIQKALYHHKRYRHGPKNHACQLCGFQFALASRLAKHMKGHDRRGETEEDFLNLEEAANEDEYL